jgi:serine protease Do
MRRIDTVAIVVTLCLLIIMVFAQVKLPSDAPDVGRRPVPEAPPAAVAPTPAAEAPELEPTPQRVRRPLPDPSPNDPVLNVNVEGIPAGKVGLGTSFSVGNGLWLTARHVANGGCQQVLVVIQGSALPAQIRYLHPEADLALLQTQAVGAPILPIANAAVSEGEAGYSFGFPHGNLGGFAASLLGRSRMQINGRLQGTAAVLAWAEERRFPDTLEALSGISGGPMLDESGNVVGIMVAVSARRGRTFSVAPEILRETRQAFGLYGPSASAPPVSEVASPPVSLETAATAMRRDARIVETVCRPGSS